MVHHITLVWLLADAGGRTGCHKAVLFCIQPTYNRPAVVNNPTLEDWLNRFVYLQVIAGWLAGLFNKGVGEPFVDGISPGYHHAGEQYGITNF
jgi:hypothetical protein